MPAFTPITAPALLDTLVERVAALPGRAEHGPAAEADPAEDGPGRAVVAIDGADAADPVEMARAVAERVRARGRPCVVVAVHDFVRPASLRLEFGRDAESYREAWFDYAALDREVLRGLRERGRWLPALWDERTDRSARAATVSAEPDLVVIVAGPMLLGRGLDFDLTVELRLSEGALRRATDPAESFTVEALLAHRRAAGEPDLLVAWDHRDRPAIRQ
ncbi:hypothetical protein ACWDSJ_36715 [Nocardia sp. NPDC003482]